MQENSPPAEEHTMSPCQRNFIQLDTFWCFLTKKSSPLLYQPEQQGVRIELLVCVCVCVCVCDAKNQMLPGEIAIGCGAKGHGLHRGLAVNVFPLEIAQTSRLACLQSLLEG